MSVDTTNLIRQAAVHLDEPVLSPARENQLLSAIRNRQERGRRHRTALISACGAVALVMLLYVQFRSSPTEPKPERASAVLATPNQVDQAVAAAPVTDSTSSDARGKELGLSPITGPAPTVVQRKELAQPAPAPSRSDTAIRSQPTPAGPPDPVETVLDRADAGTPEVATAIEEVDATLSVDALWGLVDHQRAGRHYSQAITTLEMLLKTYPSDSRAFLAAFTLARTLEATGKDRRRISRSYERAYNLAPAGPLAQDSLKRALTTMQQTTHSSETKRLERRWQEAFGAEEDSAEPREGHALP
jgi:hypothetical protein